MAALAAAQAALSAQGLGALQAELLLYFAALYTFPGLLMVAVTSAARRRMAAAGDKDTSAVQVVRLTNRAIASTAMFTLPAVVVFRNLAVWSPWGGGTWCAPLDPLQTALLHMQLMYYVMDTPYTLYKRDVEQIVHHTIGFGLALPTVRLGKCGLPMCAVMFTEQGSSIWVRYTKLCRYFLPPYNALERALVALNYYQNFYVMAFFINTPLLLRLAHEILLGTGFPITGMPKLVLGGAILLQLVYDWYWNLRLRASWGNYQKKLKALRGGAKKKA